MPGGSAARRILGYPQRAILGALMSLAVIVLERRIRRAIRRDAAAGAGLAAR